jgi:translocation and assembly module TamA
MLILLKKSYRLLLIFKLGFIALSSWQLDLLAQEEATTVITKPMVTVKIEGIEKDNMLKAILAAVSLEQQKNHPRLSPRRIKRLHQQAPIEIKRTLQAFGYYQAQVAAQLTPPPADKTAWQARYVITLGEPLTIEKIDLKISGQAQIDQVFHKLLANLPLKVGDVLNHSNYEKIKQQLQSLAQERGYFEAKLLKNEIRFDEQAYNAEIVIWFNSQQRYRFGEITFEQDFFTQSLLKRLLNFKTYDFYDSNTLLALKEAFTNSNYFEEVAVEIQSVNQAQRLVPIQVSLKRRKPNKYTFGIGYATDTGVRGSVEWQRRYINRYGHHFSLKAELAETRRGGTARYFIPLGTRIDNFLTITGGYKKEMLDTSDSEMLSIGVHKNHFRHFWNQQLTEVIGIEYRDERYMVGSDTGHAKMLMPSINWSYFNADDRLYTSQGIKVKLGIQGALSNVGSNVSFLQTHLNTTYIHQLFDKGRIIARGELGYSAISLLDGEFHDLPPSIRFFAGGDRSVRGYDYHSLGPKNDEGAVIGGKNLLVSSIEYEHRILEQWSVAAFYDLGNAFNDFSQPLKQGAGIGVRWHSPVGPIRLDVATALDEDGYPIRLYATVGPDL